MQFFFVFFLKGSRENVQMITCSLVKFHLLKFRLLKFCHECEPLVIVPFHAIRMEMRNKSLVKCHISGVGGGGGARCGEFNWEVVGPPFAPAKELSDSFRAVSRPQSGAARNWRSLSCNSISTSR